MALPVLHFPLCLRAALHITDPSHLPPAACTSIDISHEGKCWELRQSDGTVLAAYDLQPVQKTTTGVADRKRRRSSTSVSLGGGDLLLSRIEQLLRALAICIFKKRIVTLGNVISVSLSECSYHSTGSKHTKGVSTPFPSKLGSRSSSGEPYSPGEATGMSKGFHDTGEAGKFLVASVELFLHCVLDDVDFDLNSHDEYSELRTLLRVWGNVPAVETTSPNDEPANRRKNNSTLLDFAISDGASEFGSDGSIKAGGSAESMTGASVSIRKVLDSIQPTMVAMDALPPAIKRVAHTMVRRSRAGDTTGEPLKDYQLQAINFMVSRELHRGTAVHSAYCLSSWADMDKEYMESGAGRMDASPANPYEFPTQALQYFAWECWHRKSFDEPVQMATVSAATNAKSRPRVLRAHAHPLWARLIPQTLTVEGCKCAFFWNEHTGVVVRERCMNCARPQTFSSLTSASGISGMSYSLVSESVTTDCVAERNERIVDDHTVNLNDVQECDGDVAGGLLCDEPGLGKTAECIGLICAHPYSTLPPLPKSGQEARRIIANTISMLSWSELRRSLQMLCVARQPSAANPPGYQLSNSAVRSRSTIVVVPSNVVAQWLAEIDRWAPHLTVYVYTGCKRMLESARVTFCDKGVTFDDEMRSAEYTRDVTLAQMCLCDVTLVSYDTLASDAKYDASVRCNSRYVNLPSPLLQVHFHRAILDELQYVDSSSAGSSLVKHACARTRMVLQLRATYRWCVSGTPFERPDDVRSCLAFLQHNPFGDDKWWRKCLHPALDDMESDTESDGSSGGDARKTASTQAMAIATPGSDISSDEVHGGHETRDHRLKATPRREKRCAGIGSSAALCAEPSRLLEVILHATLMAPRSSSAAQLWGTGASLLRPLLTPLLWRNTTNRLQELRQITMPPVFHLVVTGRFGPVETELYDDALAKAAADLLPKLQEAVAGVMGSNIKSPMDATSIRSTALERPHSAVDNNSLGHLDCGHLLEECSSALHALHQLCVHPRVVSKSAIGHNDPKVASSLSALLESRVARAAVEEEEAKLEVYKLAVALGMLVERAALHVPSENTPLESALVSRLTGCHGSILMASIGSHSSGHKLWGVETPDLCHLAETWYRWGWQEISKDVVISREHFSEEVAALRTWKRLDMACLGGLQRMLTARQAPTHDIEAVSYTLQAEVVAPFLRNKLRTELRVALSNAFFVVRRLRQPTSDWLDDIRSAPTEWHEIFAECQRRLRHVTFPPLASEVGSADCWNISDHEEIPWDEGYLEAAEEGILGKSQYVCVSETTPSPALASSHLGMENAEALCNSVFQSRVEALRRKLKTLSNAVDSLARVADQKAYFHATERLHLGLTHSGRTSAGVISISSARALVQAQLRAVLLPLNTVCENMLVGSDSSSASNSEVPTYGAAIRMVLQHSHQRFIASASALEAPELRLRGMLERSDRNLSYLRRQCETWERQMAAMHYPAALDAAAWLSEAFGSWNTWDTLRCLAIRHDVDNAGIFLGNIGEYVRMTNEVRSREKDILAARQEFLNELEMSTMIDGNGSAGTSDGKMVVNDDTGTLGASTNNRAHSTDDIVLEYQNLVERIVARQLVADQRRRIAMRWKIVDNWARRQDSKDRNDGREKETEFTLSACITTPSSMAANPAAGASSAFTDAVAGAGNGACPSKALEMQPPRQLHTDESLLEPTDRQKVRTPMENPGVFHVEDDDRDRDTCPICRGDFTEPALAPCSHVYCKACILAWLPVGHSCPVCRWPLVVKDLEYVNTDIGGMETAISMLESLDSHWGGAVGIKRAIPEPIERHLVLTDQANQKQLIHAYQTAGTKLAMVLRRVLALPLDDKCIVVSRWPIMLEMLQRGLEAHNMESKILAGNPSSRAEACRAFAERAETRVLLLNSATDCSGLTLTTANHMFIVEPQHSTSVVIQLVGRICRLGQMKPCMIYHYIIEATVEEEALRAKTVPALFGTSDGDMDGHRVGAARHASASGKHGANATAAMLQDYQELFTSLTDARR